MLSSPHQTNLSAKEAQNNVKEHHRHEQTGASAHCIQEFSAGLTRDSSTQQTKIEQTGLLTSS
jgi:hypothetical protein